MFLSIHLSQNPLPLDTADDFFWYTCALHSANFSLNTFYNKTKYVCESLRELFYKLYLITYILDGLKEAF